MVSFIIPLHSALAACAIVTVVLQDNFLKNYPSEREYKNPLLWLSQVDIIYGRGFHLFISEITFVRINSPTDGRISVEYFSSYQETGLCVLFHRKTYVLQSNHFRIHKHVSESATYSSEEFFGSVNIQFRRMLQFLSGT